MKKLWDVKSLPSNRTQLVDRVCRPSLLLSCLARTAFCLSVGLKHLWMTVKVSLLGRPQLGSTKCRVRYSPPDVYDLELTY